nr:[citrate (pro-3S)-lyase] ligase [Mitsuokella multacida]
MNEAAKIYPSDKRAMQEVSALLEQEGIRLDRNLDYTCAIRDDEGHIIATGSMYENTLRCFAVDHRHRGEGLLNRVISHLMEKELERGNLDLFLYTKVASARFFHDLGFYEIARVPNRLVFMENQPDGFRHCLSRFERETQAFLTERGLTLGKDDPIAAIVMNANPFTKGHAHLVEQASRENKLVHIFLLSEDVSLVPYAARKELVERGIADFGNVVLHASGPYIISNATFPSYFLPDDDAASIGHAELDLTLFAKIAETLSIRRRYVGEEPFSQVTGLYNKVMREKLPELGVECCVIPRLAIAGRAVSASDVRQCVKDGDWQHLQELVPEATYDWLRSEAAAPVRARIAAADHVRHH